MSIGSAVTRSRRAHRSGGGQGDRPASGARSPQITVTTACIEIATWDGIAVEWHYKPPDGQPAGPDQITTCLLAHLAVVRKAVRCRLDFGVPERMGQVIAAWLSAPPGTTAVDLATTLLTGARSKDGLCKVSADSLTAVEAKARQEEELWASVRAFAQNSRWRAADG